MKGRFPAEWEVQSGLLLTWPHAGSDWEQGLDEVEKVFLDITRHTCTRQTVLVVCNDLDHRKHISELLDKNCISHENCRLFTVASNDSWARDHGPITVFQDNKPVLLDFTFNGWGGKYPAQLDNRITYELHRADAFGNTALQQVQFILEGGSIETDGLGTILTTTSCLLSKHRNHDMDRQDIEQVLADKLYAGRILWLEHGMLEGDDTDGHVDTLVRFIDPGTLVYNHAPGNESLERLYGELQQLRQNNGKPYRLVPLPLPDIRDDSGRRLPATYVNFLVINGAVLVPVYAVDSDQEVIEIFMKLFTDRKIIGIDCRPLINQYGSLHCATMNLPEGVIN